MSKKAIVTGVLGQDGSYLTEFLLSQGYEVWGVYKRVSSGNSFANINDAYQNASLHLVEGDICDPGFVNKIVDEVKPDYYFGLAAQSHVGHSFKIPVETMRVNADAVIVQLEAIRSFSPKTRFYNAATSELFGGMNCPESGFDESSVFNPRSPYAIAKLAAFYITKNYREAYGIHASSGILFNHSSPRRGMDFASRKITTGIAAILQGKESHIKMGNLEAFRDEGHAKDYVRAMHLIVEQDTPDDYVVATGAGASIREMLEHVCTLGGLKLEDVYMQDERFMRPSEVPRLLGNPSKIRQVTGWEPLYTWRSSLTEMFNLDLASAKEQA